MSDARRGLGGRWPATAAVVGALLAASIPAPATAQDAGTDDQGNTVAVGAPPPPPTTTVVAVGPPPAPPAPSTTVVAVAPPPVPPTTVVASRPVTMVNQPIVERPAAVDLVGDTARAVVARLQSISAHL